MTFGQIRIVKRTLLLLLLGSTFYVGNHLFRAVMNRDTSPPSRVEETGAAVSRQVSIEQLDSEGRTAWTLKAAESIGSTESTQQFRDVEIRFTAGEEEVPVVVTADDCELQKDSAVDLRGNVIVRDDTSLRLETTRLQFARNPDRAWTSEPVRYFREGLVGDAGNMSYSLVDRLLDLGGGVRMTFHEKGESPVRVESERASMRRREHVVQFVDSVHVAQSNRALDCGDLQVYLDETNQYIEHMEAYEAVDLRMNVTSGEILGDVTPSETAFTSEPGSKQLLTEKLEVLFRAGGEDLERLRALDGGKLVMKLPEGAREGYHKDLEGYTLAFEFDEDGRLQVLRGRGGVTLTLTPVVSGEAKKIVNARQLEAYFDPISGELTEAVCEKAVTFEQGDVRAESEKGTYRSKDSLLVLEEKPRLWDSKASIEARVIHVGVSSGDVAGMGDVRSTSKSASEPGGLFPSESNEPVYFVSEEMRYDRARDVAVYTGRARGIQGPNRIEGDRIDILQAQGELSAAGGVKTVFLQKVGEDSDAAPTTTDAERFRYGSKEDKLHYEGSVTMRSKDMTLKGKSMDVLLVEGHHEVSEVWAEGEVTIETSEGKAAGDDAKYLPKEKSMTVRGEAASLENAGKLTQAKQLTFFLGDDRILVDGREQTRTKTTYSSKPRL